MIIWGNRDPGGEKMETWTLRSFARGCVHPRATQPVGTSASGQGQDPVASTGRRGVEWSWEGYGT